MKEETVNIYKTYKEELEELNDEIAAMNGTLEFLNWIQSNQKKNFPEEVGIRRIRFKTIITWMKDFTKKSVATVRADYPTMSEFSISVEDISAMRDWREKRIEELKIKIDQL